MLLDVIRAESPDATSQEAKQVIRDLDEAEARYIALCVDMSSDKLSG